LDCPAAARLLGRLRVGIVLLADKAYDADWLRRSVKAFGAAPNIPSKANRCWHACFSAILYREHYCRLATRYEKHASNFLAMLKLAAVRLHLPIMSRWPNWQLDREELRTPMPPSDLNPTMRHTRR
jgi:transposase